jgi:uncharacterized membrane protein
MKRFILHMIADMFIVLASFLITSNIYQAPIEEVFVRYQSPLIIFVILFLIISFLFNKYEETTGRGFKKMLNLYAKSLFYTIAISVLAMYLFGFTYYSRMIILGTMLGIAVLEFIWIALYQLVLKMKKSFRNSNQNQQAKGSDYS